MKCDSINRTFPFAEWDISEWGSRYEPKNNKLGMVLIRFVGNPHLYEAPKSSCFITTHAIGAYEAPFLFKIYLFLNFLEVTHVKL